MGDRPGEGVWFDQGHTGDLGDLNCPVSLSEAPILSQSALGSRDICLAHGCIPGR